MEIVMIIIQGVLTPTSLRSPTLSSLRGKRVEELNSPNFSLRGKRVKRIVSLPLASANG
jgi:hypothetical protein